MQSESLSRQGDGLVVISKQELATGYFGRQDFRHVRRSCSFWEMFISATSAHKQTPKNIEICYYFKPSKMFPNVLQKTLKFTLVNLAIDMVSYGNSRVSHYLRARQLSHLVIDTSRVRDFPMIILSEKWRHNRDCSGRVYRESTSVAFLSASRYKVHQCTTKISFPVVSLFLRTFSRHYPTA